MVDRVEEDGDDQCVLFLVELKGELVDDGSDVQHSAPELQFLRPALLIHHCDYELVTAWVYVVNPPL